VSKNPTAIIKPLIISLLAALAMVAVWFTLSVRMDSALTWFALIAGLDIALLERWTRRREQRSAKWIAPMVTMLCCVASLWLIAALSVSYAAGFNVMDSAVQMGTGLFRVLINMRFSLSDWLILAFAPVLAYFLANARTNEHHQSI
jgi:hypothetical protein